jgi:hypothetical protein
VQELQSMLRSTQKEATALRSRAERAEEQQVGGSHQETPIFFFFKEPC